MNLTLALEKSSADRAAIEAKETAARNALAAADEKRRGFTLKAALGDATAKAALATATRERDDAAALVSDLELALQEALVIEAAAADAVRGEKIVNARNLILKLGDRRASLWDKIAALRDQAFTAFAEIEQLGTQIRESALLLPDVKNLQGVSARSSIVNLPHYDGDYLAALLLTDLPQGCSSAVRALGTPLGSRDAGNNERQAWLNIAASEIYSDCAAEKSRDQIAA